MGVNSEDVQSWIDEIMSKKGINNYKINISGSSSKGDGYMGEINFVTVVADLGKGEKQNYSMVIKSAKNGELRKKSPIGVTYLREIHLYTEVFPTIRELENEFAVKLSFTNYPTCYTVCKLDKKETLILENLKSLGYEVHDRTVTQNLEHALLVFRTYAKYHGASLALKIKKPEIFKNLTKNMTNVMGILMIDTDLVQIVKKYFQGGVELVRKNGKEAAAKRLEEEAGDIETILSRMTILDDSEAETEAVILHGDCWNNNMMFKYNGNDKSKPIEMALIDFQVSSVASPILDLSFYFYATADKSTLEQIDLLIEEYHKELTKYLNQYEINSNDILTLQRLKTSWKKYGKYGLGMAAFFISVGLCGEDEVIDYARKMGDGTVGQLEVGPLKLQKDYDRRVYDVFNHFAERFL